MKKLLLSLLLVASTATGTFAQKTKVKAKGTVAAAATVQRSADKAHV